MNPRLSRRDVLRHAGIGSILLANPALLAACANEALEPPAPLSIDPQRSWWMQNNFAPVPEERELLGLEVTGEIPADLSGTYIRNGPNPKHGDRGHWFVGDGMLHGVRLHAGRAEWYRNRWVQTSVLERDAAQALRPASSLTETPSNVSLVQHAGRLLSLGEVGLPFEVTPELATRGVYDFAGKLKTFMTAHPKIDPMTGELHMFGYGIGIPHLTYHLVSASGELLRSVPITLPRPAMIHDFQITRSWIVFYDLPVLVDAKAALNGAPLPFRWQPENGARIGLMPRAGGDADVIWLPIDPCYFFHAWNAYEDAMGQVILDVCRMASLWVDTSTDFDVAPTPHRYTLDPVRRSVELEQLDDQPVDFPRIDERRIGLPHRYGYGLVFDRSADASRPDKALLTFGGHRLVKYDRESQRATSCDLGEARSAGEALFVPRGASTQEDDGYLMSLVFDRRSQLSSLEIFAARQLERGAIASVQLPVRIPHGIHGVWVAG
ncbi:MAG TPA: carotenoid oxygenase family protein [Polyangiales bacterium]|nr:carotenoid oxygenase family protein [Polyangiales bacterium]